MATLRQSPIIRETIDESGHYDAARLAKLLGWSLADLGRYLERDASTISRSGSAHVHQDRLATLAALIQEVFVLMNEDLLRRSRGFGLRCVRSTGLHLVTSSFAAISPKFAISSAKCTAVCPCSRRLVQGGLQPRADRRRTGPGDTAAPFWAQRNTFFRAMLLRYVSDPLGKRRPINAQRFNIAGGARVRYPAEDHAQLAAKILA
jgi:hypothetical protein